MLALKEQDGSLYRTSWYLDRTKKCRL